MGKFYCNCTQKQSIHFFIILPFHQFAYDREELQTQLAYGLGSQSSWVHSTYGKGAQYVTLFGKKGQEGGSNVVFSGSKKFTVAKKTPKKIVDKPDFDDDSEDFENEDQPKSHQRAKRGLPASSTQKRGSNKPAEEDQPKSRQRGKQDRSASATQEEAGKKAKLQKPTEDDQPKTRQRGKRDRPASDTQERGGKKAKLQPPTPEIGEEPESSKKRKGKK
jgi:hypothetical protein